MHSNTHATAQPGSWHAQPPQRINHQHLNTCTTMCIAEQQQGTTGLGHQQRDDGPPMPTTTKNNKTTTQQTIQSSWNARQLQLMRHMQGLQAARAAQSAHNAALHSHLVSQWQAAGTGPLWDPEDLQWYMRIGCVLRKVYVENVCIYTGAQQCHHACPHLVRNLTQHCHSSDCRPPQEM